MYLPGHFEVSDPVLMRSFMRAHPLATLIVVDAAGLAADHIPLLVTGDEASGWKLAGHVARANPLWKKAETGIDCLAIFHGPQHYISPNWYATKSLDGKVVPTWNYEVVHVRGVLRAIDDEAWLNVFLKQLTATHESEQSLPWNMEDAPEDYLQRMMRAVVGIEVGIVEMIGKAKLSQNQPGENRISLIDGLRKDGAPGAMTMATSIAVAKILPGKF